MEGHSTHRAIPAEERVFSLVLALVASPQGLTKRELLSSVHGYSGRYRSGETDPALERQFERDKDQVRALGIPIETIDSPEESGNTQLARYRISKDLLQFPAEARFSAPELSVLRLASFAWAEGSLSAESRRAAMKLESLGAGLDVAYLGFAPHLGIPEPSAPALQRGIDELRVATFRYQLPHRDAPATRSVAPLRLHQAEGRWHLIAWDLEREAGRVFLLSRIVGEVKLGSQSFDPELRDRVEGMLDDLLALRERQVARLLVRRGSVAEARLAAREVTQPVSPGEVSRERESDPVHRYLMVMTLDFTALASELASYGDEIVSVEPPELHDAVVALLEEVRHQHAVPEASDG
ncbi:helix-turn-helix transcriptional regulator [Leucobacter sp. W1153]|uniref:helix-turn-helix transcriptional regulator n=1 Tax=Leucobacter sp. W1153 TaxID=3439064 RepID=UPI003F2B1740